MTFTSDGATMEYYVSTNKYQLCIKCLSSLHICTTTGVTPAGYSLPHTRHGDTIPELGIEGNALVVAAHLSRLVYPVSPWQHPGEEPD